MVKKNEKIEEICKNYCWWVKETSVSIGAPGDYVWHPCNQPEGRWLDPPISYLSMVLTCSDSGCKNFET